MLPNSERDIISKVKVGFAIKTGYFSKRLLHGAECDRKDFEKCPHDGSCEIALFLDLYKHFRESYDFDAAADDVMLVDALVTHIQLQRKEPVPTAHEQGENSAGRSRVFDYSVARQKLLISLFDQLGISRKQRKMQEAKDELKDELAEFFVKDGRTRSSSGRTRVPVRVEDASDSDPGVSP